MKKEYDSLRSLSGPILLVENVEHVKYDELVEIKQSNGNVKLGKVLEITDKFALIQMFEDTQGISLDGTRASFLGKSFELPVSKDILGRVFDGSGNPIDGGTEIIPEKYKDINGEAMNPYSRAVPNDFIETGISTIDCLNTLVRGQKLPIFSGAGLPHSRIACQIAQNSRVKDGSDFAVVFGAMGVSFEEAEYFISEFKNTGASARSTLFINTANNPVVERIAVPRLALTTAEYLAFECDMHVLVILTDLTNYAEALREVSAARKEIPGRRGYPGYLYTDLATIYERAGMVRGKKGSITQIPILSMPEDDITHPIPDLTGYITEGQIVISRELDKKGIYPPVNVTLSLSRLAPTARKITREDHDGLFSQLYASYSRGLELRELAMILGESSLSDEDKKFLQFAGKFENEFIDQKDDRRTIEDTFAIAWNLFADLPRSELKRVKKDHIEKYLPKTKA